MRASKSAVAAFCLGSLMAIPGARTVWAQQAKEANWARVLEDADRIKIETDQLEAAIPKQKPKHWMTGIEKGSFVDRKTGFHEIGDGSGWRLVKKTP